MKIAVCVKQSAEGEINPLDACAYEAALSVKDAEVILVSMGPKKSEEMLSQLSRLGAQRTILISDIAFAGADTLATAYVLSLAMEKLSPDLIICGSKTIDGETGQVGIELASMLSIDVFSRVMKLYEENGQVFFEKREGGKKVLPTPSLITVERINTLRLPSIFSKAKEVEVWDADFLDADKTKCGGIGSPTRVLKSEENLKDRRNCKFISPKELLAVLKEKAEESEKPIYNGPKMKGVIAVGEDAKKEAEYICDGLECIPITDAETIINIINEKKPTAVLWQSDDKSKEISATVAAKLSLGLCADCTALETDGNNLYFYRPAFSGSVIAKIECKTTPAMATLRTRTEVEAHIVVGFGMGVKNNLEGAKRFAERLGAETAASRALVDSGAVPYEKQVGVTGKSISPENYIALGISGAVHHISGIRTAKKIIAINPDKRAPIFNFADFGVVASLEEVLEELFN